MAKEVTFPDEDGFGPLSNGRPDPELHPKAEVRTETDDAEDHGSLVDLSQIKIIPQVRKCNFSQFKTAINPFQEGIYAVDVLESDSTLEEEMQEELKARHTSSRAPTKKKAKGMKPLAKSMLNTQLDPKEITRIRVQSPAVLAVLSRILQESWDSRPRCFLRPFCPLIYFLPQVKEILNDLERNHFQKETLEAARTPGSLDAVSEHDADVRGSSSFIDDSVEALAELRCYVDFMEQDVMRLYRQFENLDGSHKERAKVRFCDLWFLFRVGEHVYRPMGTGADKETNNGNLGQRSWRVYGTQVSWSKQRISPNKGHRYTRDDDGYRDKFSLHCYYIDFTGTEFCVVKDTFEIEPYDGYRTIKSLIAFPWRFGPNPADTERLYKSLGRKFVKYIEARHASYDWWTLTVTPKGEPAVDVDGLSPLQRPEYINGEVIVDFVEAFQTCPKWKPIPSVLKAEEASPLTIVDEIPIYWWSVTDGIRTLTEMNEFIVIRSGVTTWERNKYVMETDKLLVKIREKDKSTDLLTAEDLDPSSDILLLPSRLFAYALRERKFVQVDVSRLNSVTKVVDAYDCLKIKSRYKDLIQSLVDDHFSKKKADTCRNHGEGEPLSLDWIKGKGKGLIILLHGVPGVGKTATAEAVAQASGKPLFAITCGDLGLTPVEVETALQRIFRLANTWDCVLLLDEVDTFFSQRTKGDSTLIKNALVSVFLRVLEYYDGLLFLTTNRPGALDEAFKSRIHLTLYYPPLDIRQTMDIWNMNLKRLRKVEEERCRDTGRQALQIDKREILDFAETKYFDHKGKFRWNGRQIRNGVQVAASLAHFDARKSNSRPRLTVDHFHMIHTVTEDFDLFMQEAVGKTEGEGAFDRGERVNDDWTADQARREQLLGSYDAPDRPHSPGGFRGGGVSMGMAVAPRPGVSRGASSPYYKHQAELGAGRPPSPSPSANHYARGDRPSISLNDRPVMPWGREPSPRRGSNDVDPHQTVGRQDNGYQTGHRGYGANTEEEDYFRNRKHGRDTSDPESPTWWKKRKGSDHDEDDDASPS